MHFEDHGNNVVTLQHHTRSTHAFCMKHVSHIKQAHGNEEFCCCNFLFSFIVMSAALIHVNMTLTTACQTSRFITVMHTYYTSTHHKLNYTEGNNHTQETRNTQQSRDIMRQLYKEFIFKVCVCMFLSRYVCKTLFNWPVWFVCVQH